MKKKAILRCLTGAPLGLALSTIITIIISYTVGDGRFYAVVPELITDCGGELNAVTIQAACSLLYGAAWGGASLVWEAERWSLLRQTLTHLVICSLATFPVAYLMRWMQHTPAGIALYFAIFLFTYACIWLGQYSAMRRKVAQMNSRLRAGDGRG